MAHQGGEQEAPGNTLFAYKTAVAAGADMIDMDAYLTADNELVLTHDLRPANTSNAPNDAEHEITDLTLAQLRQYDFAYWFTPWNGTYYEHSDTSKPHPYRGIATGEVAPPANFTADDFKIATFDQVLDAFPNTPINIELKTNGVDPKAIANKAAAILTAHPGREKDVIVNSFAQATLEDFHAAAPNHLSMGGSEESTLGYLTGSPIVPTPVSLQPPDFYLLSGNWVRPVPLLRDTADYDGYTIVVWGSDHDPLQDTWPFYSKLIDEGADAYNTTRPSMLHSYLCNAGIRRPDGTQRCASQTPDVVPCPEGTVGEAPTCIPAPVAEARIYDVSGPKKLRGKSKARFRVTVGNSGDAALTGVRVKVKVPSALKSRIKPGAAIRIKMLPAKAVVHRGITVRTTGKGKGKKKLKLKILLTSDNGGSASKVVNPVYQPSGSQGTNPLYDGKR